MDRQEAQDRQDIRARQERNAWQLNRVDDVAWTQDKSGTCVFINWDVETETARLDIMTVPQMKPLQSFAGKADNVRKHVVRWLSDNVGIAVKIRGISRCGVSAEHISYIGYELARCDAERIDYVQD